MALHEKSIPKAYPLDSSPDPVGFESNGAPIYDRQYSAADLRSLYTLFFSDGVFADRDDELAVTMRGGSWIVGTGAAMCGGLLIENREEFTVIDQADIPRGQYAYLCVEARFDSTENDGHIYARLSTSAAEAPVRTESNHEVIIARVDWTGKCADLRMDQAYCGPVAFRFDVDTESFMKELSTAVSQFNLNVGEVTAQQPGSTPTVTVRKPEVAGGEVYIDFGIPRGAKGEPGRDGDTAPTMYINPEDEEPPRVYGNSWLVDDKATHTITAVRCYETDRVYPGAETFPGAEVFPGGTGQWVPHKLSRDLFAE